MVGLWWAKLPTLAGRRFLRTRELKRRGPTPPPFRALIRDSNICTADVGLCREVVTEKFTVSFKMTYLVIFMLATMHDSGLWIVTHPSRCCSVGLRLYMTVRWYKKSFVRDTVLSTSNGWNTRVRLTLQLTLGTTSKYWFSYLRNQRRNIAQNKCG